MSRRGVIIVVLFALVVAALVGAAATAAARVGTPRFLVRTNNGTVELLDSRGRLVRTIVHSVVNAPVQLSPDHSELAWVSSKGLALARVSGGPPRLLLPEPRCNSDTHECLAEEFAWSPDGKRLLVSGLGPQRTRLRIVSAATGQGRTIATGAAFSVTGGWSPNGKWMIYQPDPKRLVLARGDGSHSRTIARFPQADMDAQASWSPDSREVAITEVPNRQAFIGLSIYHTATGRLRRLQGVRPYLQSPAWSPDSKLVAVGLEYGGTETLTVTGRKRRVLHAGEGPLNGGPAWTSGGLYISDLEKIWRSRNGHSKPVPLFAHIPDWEQQQIHSFQPFG